MLVCKALCSEIWVPNFGLIIYLWHIKRFHMCLHIEFPKMWIVHCALFFLCLFGIRNVTLGTRIHATQSSVQCLVIYLWNQSRKLQAILDTFSEFCILKKKHQTFLTFWLEKPKVLFHLQLSLRRVSDCFFHCLTWTLYSFTLYPLVPAKLSFSFSMKHRKLSSTELNSSSCLQQKGWSLSWAKAVFTLSLLSKALYCKAQQKGFNDLLGFWLSTIGLGFSLKSLFTFLKWRKSENSYQRRKPSTNLKAWRLLIKAVLHIWEAMAL